MCQSVLPRSKTVMIVEDDPFIQEALKCLLEMESYQVVAADNGRQAYELLTSTVAPCLILLDLMMPVMTGQELISEISKDSELSKIPIVVMSAVANPINSRGARGYMRKPAEIDEILKTVETYCKN